MFFYGEYNLYFSRYYTWQVLNISSRFRTDRTETTAPRSEISPNIITKRRYTKQLYIIRPAATPTAPDCLGNLRNFKPKLIVSILPVDKASSALGRAPRHVCSSDRTPYLLYSLKTPECSAFKNLFCREEKLVRNMSLNLFENFFARVVKKY